MCWNYKRPVTANERRKTQVRGPLMEVDGYIVRIRGSRNCKNLPNAWDESIAMGAGNSWKNYRKTRWKTK